MRTLIGGLFVSLALISFSQAQTTPKPRLSVTVSDEEAEVLSRLHDANRKEIAAGALAVERARMADVRSFGQHLIDDHTAADRELKALAKRKNVPLTDSDSSQLDDLEATSGAKFDRVFVSRMLKDHEAAIRMVEDAQGRAKDPDVLTFLKQTLPTLVKHRDMAEKLSGDEKS